MPRLILLLILFISAVGYSQTSPQAKKLFQQALADTTAKQDSIAAFNFYEAAKAEKSSNTPDLKFVSRSLTLAAEVAHYRANMFTKAHKFYLEALEAARNAKDQDAAINLLADVGSLYKLRYGSFDVFSFPSTESKENLQMHFPIIVQPEVLKPGQYKIILEGGTDDGVYVGAEGIIWSTPKENFSNRRHKQLGTISITNVYPGICIGVADIFNDKDSFHRAMIGDLIQIPVRVNEKSTHDMIDDLNSYCIRFYKTGTAYLVHPRTILYNQNPQLYKEIYSSLVKSNHDTYEDWKTRNADALHTPIAKGRYAGKTILDVLKNTTETDIKAFLGFMKTYPTIYMGDETQFSGLFSVWAYDKGEQGAFEAMDSLIKYKNDTRLFTKFTTQNTNDITEYYWNKWVTEIQENVSTDSLKARTYSATALKVAEVLKSDSLAAWGNWVSGYTYAEYNSQLAIDFYKKSIDLFRKTGDVQGLTYAINNIGSVLSTDYKYKEAEKYFIEALEIRKKDAVRDTTEDARFDLGSSYVSVGNMQQKQGKNKEAIASYREAIAILKKLPAVKSKSKLASASSKLAAIYEEIGDYATAATFYNYEYEVRRLLADDEGMGDALDHKAYLLSKLGNHREALETYRQAYTLHMKSGFVNDAGFSMSNMGQSLWKLGKFDSAILAHNEAIALRGKADDKKGVAYSWKKLGQLYSESGDPVKSNEAFNKALVLYQQVKDETEIASIYKEFASSYEAVKDYSKALQYHQLALGIYKKVNSKSDIADVLQNIALTYYTDLQYVPAEKYNDSAINLLIELGNNATLIYSYQVKSSLLQSKYGNYKAALEMMRKVLELSIKTTSESNVAYAYISLGSLMDNMGVSDSAIFYYRAGLEKYKKLENKNKEASAYSSMGYYYSNQSMYDSARYYFNKAVELGKAINDKSIVAYAIDGITSIETSVGNFEKALAASREVNDIWIEQKNPWGTASAALSLGNIYNIQSNYPEAVKNYQVADSFYKSLGMEKTRATPINNIATIYFSQKDYKKALQEFTKALALLELTGDDPRFISLVKSNLGEVYNELKDYTSAEKYLNEAIAIGKAIKNTGRQFEPIMILARSKTTRGELDQASKLFEQANSLLNEAEKPSRISLEVEYGTLFFKQKDYINAEKHLKTAIDLSTEVGIKTYSWRAYNLIGDIRLIQNRKDEAVKQLEMAIKIVEDIKLRLVGGAEAKKIFTTDESIVELYQKMARLLKDLGRNDEALGYLEKSNIENISLRFKNDDAATKDQAALQKKAELNTLEKQKVEELSKPAEKQSAEKIARLDKMQTIAEKDYQQYITSLAVKDSGRMDLHQVNVRDFRSEREFIPDDVALISYLVSENELSIFIATKDSLLIKDIPINKKLLEKKITQFYNANAKPGSKIVRGIGTDKTTAKEDGITVEQLSRELYELLLQPAKSAIAGKQRIAIVPTNLLSFLPFHALITNDVAGAPKYFGDEKQVFYVNKINTVTNGRNRKMSDLKILAAGNADKTLASAQDEVLKLHTQFPDSKIYTGDAATKKNVLGTEGDYNILHLATHGMMDYNHAENSYLVFAVDKSSGDDGKLKIQDIDKLTNIKRFKMITLSACETAVIQNVTEGWPISTATAFLEAGVPTVIATLWKVDDKATAVLMEKFYDNLKTMDKVAALQDAQRFLRNQKQFSDPNYWAPFQLVGLWQ